MYYLEMFGISLLLTLILESLVLVFLKGWTKKNQILLVLVNILTNPAAVMLIWLSKMYLGQKWNVILQVPLEAVVILVEAKIYGSFSKAVGWSVTKPIKLAVLANVISWTAGMIVQILI